MIGLENIGSHNIAEHIGLVRKGGVILSSSPDVLPAAIAIYAFGSMNDFYGKIIYGTGEQSKDKVEDSADKRTKTNLDYEEVSEL